MENSPMRDRLNSIRPILVALLLWGIPLDLSFAVTKRQDANAARLVAGMTPIVPKPPSPQKQQAEQLHSTGFGQLSAYQYQDAIASFQAALQIYREIGDSLGQASVLYGLGWAYDDIGQLQKAIESYQNSLAIAREIGDRRLEATNLNLLGYVYFQLGQSNQAIELNQQSLAIARANDLHFLEALSLVDLGLAHLPLGNYHKAIEFAQQALSLARQQDFKLIQAYVLNDLGNAHQGMGNPQQAIEFHQQSIAIARKIGNRYWEVNALSALGRAYQALENDPLALTSYQQALTIAKDINYLAGQGKALSHIGQLLAQQEYPELAILFYKQSVNAYESIRKGIQGLPPEQQRSYTATVANTYRNLADLLLKQDRILEAQRVLDLLKVQELEEYLQNVRGNSNTTQGIPNTPPERQIWTSYEDLVNQAIQIGQERAQLAQLPRESLTPQQQQRLSQLIAAQEALNQEFNAFIRSPEVEALIAQLSPETRKPDLVDDLEDLNALQRNLADLNQNAVLFYPLILEDRLELVLTTPNSPPIRRTVPVTREQLNATVRQFRSQLQTPTRSAKKPAQQLYDWLIKPIEADLQAANAETIIYSPDGVLRYIPLAALYDGEEWLVQRFRINNITAASLTNLNSEPQSQPRILAGAFANVSYPVTVGEEEFFFKALPFAGTEVENLAEQISSTTPLFDDAFALQATKEQMNDYTIVHLATHGAFVVGTPEDSFILFGDGKIATLREIQNWSLTNVDLVVLSACQTGLGGKFENGEEILGLGYQFQRAGARATLASLWSVDDGGTQALMNGFYGALQGSGMTKAEALRQAQIALITGDYSAVGGERGIVAVRSRDGIEPEVEEGLSHPYYWAAFILIGNGL
ncbi:CHAT domain-containing protein [Lusitaniella coriacea]|uniref:CHAT domain-containing protein n=1 Tax=Lusitaniella coriacea TaxID=1983105 RepID=UPI003CF6D9BC